MDNLLITLSNSKIFAGAIMLLTNVGGKYLALEIPSSIDKLFTQNYILRYLVVFSIFFMATRDIKMSIVLALLFFIIIRFFISEKSSFCILSENNPVPVPIPKKISREEYEKAKEIIKKYSQT